MLLADRVMAALDLAPMTSEQLALCLGTSQESIRRVLHALAIQQVGYRKRARRRSAPVYAAMCQAQKRRTP